MQLIPNATKKANILLFAITSTHSCIKDRNNIEKYAYKYNIKIWKLVERMKNSKPLSIIVINEVLVQIDQMINWIKIVLITIDSVILILVLVINRSFILNLSLFKLAIREIKNNPKHNINGLKIVDNRDDQSFVSFKIISSWNGDIPIRSAIKENKITELS